MGLLTSPKSARHQVSGTWFADLPAHRPTPLPRDNHRPVELPSCVTPSACLLPVRAARSAGSPRRAHQRQVLSIAGLGMGAFTRVREYQPVVHRLPLGGLACPRTPWSFGGGVSHPSFATHACILTRVASTAGSLRCFSCHTTLPYPPAHLDPKGARD